MDPAELSQALESGNLAILTNFLESVNAGDLGQTSDDQNNIIHQIFEKATENQELAAAIQENATKLALKNGEGLSILDKLAKTEAGGGLIKEVLVKPLLIAQKEDVLTKLATFGWSDFSLTTDSEVPGEVKSLLSKLTDLRIKVTLVQAAIRDGRLDDVQSTLGEDETVLQAAGISGLLPLQQAVVYQNTDIVQHIIKIFPQTTGFKDNMGRTALHYAAGCQDEGNLYQILKEAGAADNEPDKDGHGAEYYKENPDMLKASEVKSRLESLMQGKGHSDSKTGSRPSSADKTAEDVETKTAEAESDTPVVLETTEPQAEVEDPPLPPKPQTPPGPKVLKPMAMYVSCGGVNQDKAPPPTTVDGKYIAQHLGTALTLALAEIAEKRPWDPIEYLANWLYGYHKNEAYVKQQAEMLKNIREAEAKQNELEELKFKRREELRRLREDEMRKQKEAEEEKKRQEMEEMQRSNKEAALAQKPQLPTVKEDEEAEADLEADDDPNVRERNTEGLTEMHKLASQEDIDLISLIDLGYSIADRDVKGRSVRDIAQEAGRTDTVRALDNYIKQLLADGAIPTLEKLVLEGYQDIESLAGDNIPETTRKFLQNIDNLKEQISSACKISESGNEEEMKGALEALPQLTQTKDQDGRSLLHRAVISGHKPIVEYLATQYPAMLQVRDSRNRTPLHYATGKSDDLATLLISRGAKQNAKDVYKRTPAFYKDHPDLDASQSGNASSVPAISEPEASMQEPASANETATGSVALDESQGITSDASQLATTTISESDMSQLATTTVSEPEHQANQEAQE